MRKRLLSFILAALMAISLAACGGNTNNGGNSKKDNSVGKDGVFKVADLEQIVESMNAGDSNINQMRAVNDKLYMFLDVYTENAYQKIYMSTDLEGNILNQSVIWEEVWDTGIDYEDGTEDDAIAVPLTEEVATTDVAEEEEDVWHNAYGYKVLSDGKFLYVDYYEKYLEDGSSAVSNYVVLCGENGVEIFRTNISEGLEEGESIWVDSVLESGENTLWALCYDKNFEISMNGELLGTYEANEVTQNLYSPSFYKDGKPVFSVWNEDYTEQSFSTVDFRQNQIVETFELPDHFTNYNFYDGENSGYDLVLANSTGIYGYNFGDADATLIMNYINSDLATYNVRYISFRDPEYFVGAYTDLVAYESHVAAFTKVAPEDVPDREVLTLAVLGTGSETIRAVTNFNRGNEKYKVLLEDYSKYNVTGDWEGGVTKLNNDIISGAVPDILLGNDSLVNMANYMSKGLFVDMYELIEKDDSINLEDYAENVFEAYEYEGKLYELPIRYYIQTTFGKTSIWGEESGISWEDASAVLEQYPDAALFAEMTKSSALYQAVMYNYDLLVDEETGECHFNTEKFKSILEFAAAYPEEINYDDLYADDDYWLNYQTQYMDDKVLLYNSTIYSIYDQWLSMYGTFLEDVTQVGFPTDDATQGSTLSAITSYAISAKSASVEGAWEFVKSFLGEETQIAAEDASMYSIWGIPVLKKGIEQQAAYITKKPFYFDENNEKVENDEYVWVGEEQIIVEPASQEEADEWVDFVLSVDRKANHNFEKSMEIISEEAEAYFSGAKTVEDVMGIIQSRMDIFISESR